MTSIIFTSFHFKNQDFNHHDQGHDNGSHAPESMGYTCLCHLGSGIHRRWPSGGRRCTHDQRQRGLRSGAVLLVGRRPLARDLCAVCLVTHVYFKGNGEQVMSESKVPWQAPEVLRLSVADTQGASLPNSDNGTQANNAFPSPS